MATTANPFADDDIDLYKNSRKMMAAMLMRKLSQQNPSLGGNVLNAMALGLLGLQERKEGSEREKAQDALLEAFKPKTDAAITPTQPTQTPTSPTKTEPETTAPADKPQYLRPPTETVTEPPATLSSEPGASPRGQELGRALLLDYARRNKMGEEPSVTPPGTGDRSLPPSGMQGSFEPNTSQYMQTLGVRPPPEAGAFPMGDQSMIAPRLDPNVAFGPQGLPPQQAAMPLPPPSRPQATEMDRGPVYPPPPGAGDDWGPPNGYRGPGAPLPPAPPAMPAGSPEWQRLQEYQRSQGLPPQAPPSPAMMRPGYQPPGAPAGVPPTNYGRPSAMAAPEPSPMRQEPGIRAIDQAAPQGRDLTDFVKRQEGFSPNAKWDYKQYSIGYGTKGQPGQTMTREEAEGPLNAELAKARQSVEQFAPNAPAGVKDALTSLTYNAGSGWQQAGLGRLVSEGRYDEARDRFLQYNRAGGQELPGLVSRRNAEVSNFWNAPGGGAPTQTASALSAQPVSFTPSGRPPAPSEPQPAPYQVAQAGGGPPPPPPGQLAPRMQQAPDTALIQQLQTMTKSDNEYTRSFARQKLFELYTRKPEFEHQDIPGYGRQFFQKDNPRNTFVIPYPKEAVEGMVDVERRKKEATEKGEAGGKAIAALPKVESDIQDALGMIKAVRAHPGRSAVGTFGNLWAAVPGTKEAAFGDMVNQLKGKAFLPVYESLRGTGAVTEKEGEKASGALERLKLARRPEDFEAALNDFEGQMIRLRDIAREKAGVGGGGTRGGGGEGGWIDVAPGIRIRERR